MVKNNDKTYVNILESFLKKLNMQELEKINDWYIWKDPKATISRKIFDQ